MFPVATVLVITAETCEVTDVVNLLFEDTPLFDLGEDFETCFENVIQLDATPSNMDVSECYLFLEFWRNDSNYYC